MITVMMITKSYERNNNCNNRRSKIKRKLCNNICVEERNDKFNLGARIIKKFNNVPYEGKIIGYRDRYYKIQYTDNTNEELTHYQVRIRLKNKILVRREARKRRTFDKLLQCNMRGELIPVRDSEFFGHQYPTKSIQTAQ